MGTGDELGPDQGVFSLENLGIDGFQLFSADVIVPVAVGPLQVRFSDRVVHEGFQDLGLVVNNLFVDFMQAAGDLLVDFLNNFC